jgi:hypothetical protein
MRRFTVISILCAALGCGCARSRTQPSPLPLGQSFELRAGASATLQSGLTVTFERVGSDSRCPMDALCVWVGDAIVMVSLSQAAGGQVQRELHTLPTGSEASYLAYSVTLVALAPYPRSDRRIRPEDYEATLIVAAR